MENSALFRWRGRRTINDLFKKTRLPLDSPVTRLEDWHLSRPYRGMVLEISVQRLH